MSEETMRIVEEFINYLFRGGKMSPTLYYISPSPPCRAILMLAKMIDLDLNLKVVNVMEGEQMKQEFVDINPQHCVPTIDDAGLVLWESRVIMTYLVSAYAKEDTLYPKDVRTRALVDQRLHFDLGTLYKRTVDYFFPTMMIGAPLDEAKKAKLAESLYWLETILKGRSYLAAEHFTIADLTITVTVSQIEAFNFQMNPYPRVRQWLEKCKTYLEPYGYEEINQKGAEVLSDMFYSKLSKATN